MADSRVAVVAPIEQVKKVAEKDGLRIQRVEFSDYIQPNAAQLPRSLDDLDASAVNTNYALSAGLDPVKDAIAREAAKSPYVNLLAVREQDKDKPWVAKLVKACHSEEIRKFIQTEFKGAVLTGF